MANNQTINKTIKKSTKRTIIIPSGTLNADETTIIHVPRKLNNAAPLLVTNYRDDTFLKVQSLPIWYDELSDENNCFPDIHWKVQGPGCTDKETLFAALEPHNYPDEDCTGQPPFEVTGEDCEVCPPPGGVCPPTCINVMNLNAQENPFDQNDSSPEYYQYPFDPLPQNEASGSSDKPPCCYNKKNPNIRFDFRPAYECDFPSPKKK